MSGKTKCCTGGTIRKLAARNEARRMSDRDLLVNFCLISRQSSPKELPMDTNVEKTAAD